MPSSWNSSQSFGESDPEFDRLVEDLIQRIQAREALHFDEIARDYPHHADRLQQLWPSLTALGVAFSFDGELLLGSAVNGDVRLWTQRGNEPIGKPMIHSAQIGSLGFSPDGKFAITACHDRYIRRWRIPEAEMLEVLA